MTFRGIPVEVIQFYDQLEADNSKTFWEANTHAYRDVVKPTARELCEELG